MPKKDQREITIRLSGLIHRIVSTTINTKNVMDMKSKTLLAKDFLFLK
jgi:hypothetical protein